MKPVTLYLVALNDGTDEIFNIGCHTLTVNPGETAGDAWGRMLDEEYKAAWAGSGNFEETAEDVEEGETPLTEEQGYKRWMNERFYVVSLVDLTRVCDEQNARTTEMIEAGAFVGIEDTLKLVDALVAALRTLA